VGEYVKTHKIGDRVAGKLGTSYEEERLMNSRAWIAMPTMYKL
jgi:hypothetical protein